MKRIFIAAVLAAMYCPSGSANDLSYSLVEGGLLWVDADHFQSELGYGLAAQIAVSERFFVWGSLGDVDAQSNFLEPDISLKEYAVGAGYHHPISQNTDFVARAGWGDARRRFFSNDGFVASLALRSQWTEDRAETTIGLGYDDTGAGEEAVAFVSGAYPFNQTLGLSSTFKYGERGTSIFLGLRATF